MRVLRVSQPIHPGQHPTTMVVREIDLKISLEQAMKEQIELARDTPVELEAYYAIFEWPDDDSDNMIAITLKAEQDLRNQVILRHWLRDQINKLAVGQGIQTTQPAPLTDDVLEYELKLIIRRPEVFNYRGQPINLIAKDGTRISLVNGRIYRPQPGELELLFAESMIEKALWRLAQGTPQGVTAYEASVETEHGPPIKLLVGSDGKSFMGTMVVGGSIVKLPDKLITKAFNLAQRHWLTMQNPRLSLTYGELPKFRDFKQAFESEVPTGRYRLRLNTSDARTVSGTVLGDGDHTVEELWVGVNQLTHEWEHGNEAAGNLASDILTTLGFEWV